MARKMHCALQEISTESPKISKPGKDSLSRKQQEKILRASLKDFEESSLSRRNSDSRCSILAFLTFGPDGNWRIVALPVWCLGHINLASGVIMDGLQLVFPTPLNRSKIDWHKGLRGPLPDYAYPVKSFTGRSVAGSNVHRRCQNKIADRASKLSEISGNSCSHPLICNNSSGLFPDSSAVVNSSDMFMSNSKADKSVKKNSRKKAKKKGRQSKKQSSDSGSTEPEVVPEVYDHVSLTSETCGSNNVHDEFMLMSYTIGPEFSSSDHRLIKNDSERNEVNDRINLFEAPKSCTSCTDGMEMPEAITSVVQKSGGESAMCNSKNELQNKDPDLAITDGQTKDVQQIQLCCCNDVYPIGLSDMQDSLVLDSVSVASNSDESTNASVVEKQSNKASCSIGCSEPVSKSGDEFIIDQKLLNVVGNDNDHSDRIKHSAQNCSSSDKRVKQKKTSQSSSVNKFGGIGNFHVRAGKENSHSVWQKVQKNNSDECNGDSKKVNTTLSEFDSTFKRAPPVNRNCKFVGANSLSKTEDKKLLKNKVSSRKSKGKMDSDLKKGYCSYSRKGYRDDRSILNDSVKVCVQLNDMSQISSQENSQEILSSVSGSHSHTSSLKVGSEANRIEQVTSESVHSAQVHLEDSDPPEDILNNISTMNNQNIVNQDSSLSISCDHINQSSVSEEQSPIHSHLSSHGVGQTEKEISSADYNSQNNSSGSILWKWIPVGKKEAGLTISSSESSSQEYSAESLHEDSTFESNAETKMVSFLQNHVSLSNESETCMDQKSCSISCPDEDENKKLGNQIASTLTEHRDKHKVANHLNYECEYHGAFETYAYRIAQAVNDACRVQLACESIHVASGGPIAEFERLLHKCSPFMCQSPISLSYLTCSQDHANGAPLCRHETPDLSLGCLWQWYEKHGSYGLEIRAQEYKSKRLGGGHFPFCAYFVPSLSAVQLFKDHKFKCIHRSGNFCHSNISEAFVINDMSERSSDSQHPIFSVLFPQPRNQDASFQTPKSQMHCSEVSSSAKDNLSGPSINSACSGDLELLFEYFESEQPQQRQPLYEKIQELVSGYVPSQSKVYGDPTILDSVNLQDIHPRSWYSVAWYPIYRIPDGNFRAAFLTYHSLGHLVCRSIKSDSPTINSCIESPVVGLQSYNTQGECWFQLSQSAQTAEMLGLNPSILLKERLRTLEETASLMARAAVKKGDLICTNSHPDYEFFLSRRR